MYILCYFIDISKIDSIKIIKFDWQKAARSARRAHNSDEGDDGIGDDNSNGDVDYGNEDGRCGGLYFYHSMEIQSISGERDWCVYMLTRAWQKSGISIKYYIKIGTRLW